MVARPPKGKRHTRVQADRYACLARAHAPFSIRLELMCTIFARRIAKIQQNLAEMDKKIADYKKVCCRLWMNTSYVM